MARVPLPDASAVVARLPGLSDSLDLASLDVIRAQANEPAVLEAVLRYVQALYDCLPPDVRELTILAVARARDSEYEWHQHAPVAVEEGVPLATIRAIGGEDHDSLDAVDRAVVEFVRAQCRGEVTDERFDALAAHLEVPEIVAVSRLAGNYGGTAEFIQAMGLSSEGEFVGWELGA